MSARELKGELRRLVLARTDITASARVLQGIPKSATDDVKWERWAAAVVAYCRPFKRSALNLAPRWAEFDDPDLALLHRQMIELRDKLFAHNDVQPQRTVAIVPPTTAVEMRQPFGNQKVIGPKKLCAAQLQRIELRIAEIVAELCHGQPWKVGEPLPLAEIPDDLQLIAVPSPFQAPRGARGSNR